MEIAETVGIEIEFPMANRRYMMMPPGFRTVHDASSETGQVVLGDSIIMDMRLVKDFPFKDSLKVKLLGGEMVSPTINLKNPEDHDNLLRAFTTIVTSNPLESPKCATHVHVNVSSDYPLYALKNLIRMISSMEKFLYTVSGFNTINRGVTNDFLFQRPFHSPPYLYVSDGVYAPALDVDMLLEADNIDRFWNLVCRAYNKDKYNPARYMGISLPSVVQRGSVEFRYGNYITDFNVLKAWINLCRNIVKGSFYISLDDIFQQERSIYHKETEDYTDVFFEILSEHLVLDPADIDILMNLYTNLPKPTLTTDEPITTHLEEKTFLNVFQTTPKKVDPTYPDKCVTRFKVGSYSRGDSETSKLTKRLRNVMPKSSPSTDTIRRMSYNRVIITKELVEKGFKEFTNGTKLVLGYAYQGLKYVVLDKDGNVIDHGNLIESYGHTLRELRN